MSVSLLVLTNALSYVTEKKINLQNTSPKIVFYASQFHVFFIAKEDNII